MRENNYKCRPYDILLWLFSVAFLPSAMPIENVWCDLNRIYVTRFSLFVSSKTITRWFILEFVFIFILIFRRHRFCCCCCFCGMCAYCCDFYTKNAARFEYQFVFWLNAKLSIVYHRVPKACDALHCYKTRWCFVM